MAYKKSAMGDKKIYTLSVVGALAVCAVVGGSLVKSEPKGSGTIQEIATTAYVSEVGVNSKNSISNNKLTDKPTDRLTDKSAEKSTDKSAEKSTDKSADILKETTGDNAISESASETTPISSVGVDQSMVNGLEFGEKSKFIWPVQGEVIINYDMDNVVYFKTLDVYKCSDAMCVSSKMNTPVYAGAKGVVTDISEDARIGKYVKMNLGDKYEVVYGQLKDVQVSNGLTVQKGDLVGYINAPTKYYALEGDNLYIQFFYNGKAINPEKFLSMED